MNNIEEITSAFDLNSYAVAPGYFHSQLLCFEEKYREEFKDGWGQFYAAYLKGLTNKSNLDYDEWAFLCEHFLKESWQPPGRCTEFHEEPEKSSRAFLLEFTFVRSAPLFRDSRANDCLVRMGGDGWPETIG